MAENRHPTKAPLSDLSGIPSVLSPSDNPYEALITACNNDPKEIEARYTLHRSTRNAQQKEKLISPDFTGINVDPILARLADPSIEPGFKDPRHGLVLWARPPRKIRELARKVQEKLREGAPSKPVLFAITDPQALQNASLYLWQMPLPNMHMTVLDIIHSRPAVDIASLVSTLRPHLTPIVDYTHTHRTRLVKPLLSFDASALALSFVPTTLSSTDDKPRAALDVNQGSSYTYHHLRRDIHTLCRNAGVEIGSRYVVPSAHITLSRFVTTKDFEDAKRRYDASKMRAFIEKIEEINAWLQEQYWDGSEHETEWIVGEEKGLDCEAGTLWYGDGEIVEVGKGL